MKSLFPKNNVQKAFAFLLATMVLVIVFGLTGRVSSQFFGAASLQPAVVTVQPPAGVYTLKSADEPLYVSMYSMVGAELWYTDDGSSPVIGKWLNRNNDNLKYYTGYSIPVTKTTTFRIVGITLYGDISSIQTVRYTIKVPEPEVKKEEATSTHNAASEKGAVSDKEEVVDTRSTGKISLQDIYKLRIQQWRASARDKVASNNARFYSLQPYGSQ